MNIHTPLLASLKLLHEENILANFQKILSPYSLIPLAIIKNDLLLYYKPNSVFFLIIPEELAFLKDESLEWLDEYLPNSLEEIYSLSFLPNGIRDRI